MPSPLRPTKDELEDLGWRCAWTFGQAFSGGLVATSFTDLSVLQAAAVAGVAAVLAAVKTFSSNKLGTGSTST